MSIQRYTFESMQNKVLVLDTSETNVFPSGFLKLQPRWAFVQPKLAPEQASFDKIQKKPND